MELGDKSLTVALFDQFPIRPSVTERVTSRNGNNCKMTSFGGEHREYACLPKNERGKHSLVFRLV